jgi:hypothetical protein
MITVAAMDVSQSFWIRRTRNRELSLMLEFISNQHIVADRRCQCLRIDISPGG